MSALRRLRVNKRLSVAQLSELSGISQEQIRNIEAGRARNPRVTTLDRLATVLNVEPSMIDPTLASQAESAA